MHTKLPPHSAVHFCYQRHEEYCSKAKHISKVSLPQKCSSLCLWLPGSVCLGLLSFVGLCFGMTDCAISSVACILVSCKSDWWSLPTNVDYTLSGILLLTSSSFKTKYVHVPLPCYCSGYKDEMNKL